jgi:5-methylcytosine-specific restriction endonuclease McrA
VRRGVSLTVLHVLLLNTSYEPLAVISERRAMSLLMRGRVEAASEETYEMKSVSQTFHVPTVIRLSRYVNAPRRGVHWNRRSVLRRDRYTCIYCGIRVGDRRRGRTLTRRDLTIDHILPVSRGGKDTWSNTACACAACNHHKGDRTPHEMNLKLRWEPKRPRVTYWVASGEIPAAWRVYLEVGSGTGP